jgi:hypothetical protein
VALGYVGEATEVGLVCGLVEAEAVLRLRAAGRGSVKLFRYSGLAAACEVIKVRYG